MAMDGHYLDKLITDAEFILLGKFYAIEGGDLIKKLAMNAVYLHTIGDISVKPGESLPSENGAFHSFGQNGFHVLHLIWKNA